MVRHLVVAAALVVTGHAWAQRTSEAQARSYVLSAFVTGVAPAIMAAEVIVSPGVRERLKLAGDATRDTVYEALFQHTDSKPIRVRKAESREAPLAASRAGASPVLAVDGGSLAFAVVYDLAKDQVTYVALVGEAPPPLAAPAPAPPPSVIPVDAARPVAVAAAPTVITLNPITFGYASARLSPQARARLDSDIPKIAASTGTRFTVQGYSDRIASSRYNQRLSQRRAEAVRDYLVAKGVPRESIRAVGLGSAVPPTECRQKEPSALRACLAPDRRVIVEIRATGT